MTERAAGLRNIAGDLASGSLATPARDLAWITELRIRDASLQTLAEAYIRGETPQEAARRLKRGLGNRGVHSFTDRANKSWSMGNYTDMVVNTVAMEADTHAQLVRIQEVGLDLVKVSDHAEECPRCRPWEGKILSVTGKTPGHATVDDAKRAGLQHPRCAHALMPYVRGSDIMRRAAA
jgi:hypothetical protein